MPLDHSGLDDVVAAETTLSMVDGTAGVLVIRGHRLEDISTSRNFEWLAGELWQGLVEVPLSGLGEARARVFERVQRLLPVTAGRKNVDPDAPADAGQECLVIEYAASDPEQPAPRLYVPVTEAHLVPDPGCAPAEAARFRRTTGGLQTLVQVQRASLVAPGPVAVPQPPAFALFRETTTTRGGGRRGASVQRPSWLLQGRQ